MKIEFYLICFIGCIIYYLLFNIFFKKKIINNINAGIKLLNLSINNNDKKKIGSIYNFLILFLILFSIINYLYVNFILDVNTISFGKNKIVCYIALPIIFFMIGILVANLKKFICYFSEKFSYLLNCLILTLSTILLLQINKYCISPLVIFFSILNLGCFYYLFRGFKNVKIEGLEFIFNFILLLLINFINTFIFIYNIWN